MKLLRGSCSRFGFSPVTERSPPGGRNCLGAVPARPALARTTWGALGAAGSSRPPGPATGGAAGNCYPRKGWPSAQRTCCLRGRKCAGPGGIRGQNGLSTLGLREQLRAPRVPGEAAEPEEKPRHPWLALGLAGQPAHLGNDQGLGGGSLPG